MPQAALRPSITGIRKKVDIYLDDQQAFLTGLWLFISRKRLYTRGLEYHINKQVANQKKGEILTT
jgi:hypothetical protein